MPFERRAQTRGFVINNVVASSRTKRKRRLKVLVACEFSGTVRDAFLQQGHDAVSCDLLPSDRDTRHLRSGHILHYQCDILYLLDQQPCWDLIIAHPPCTYLTNAGARWLYLPKRKGSCQTKRRDPKRWQQMHEAVEFFNRFLDLPDVPFVAVENPIMHKHSRELIAAPYDQIIQPWQHGHAETKATCLWLKGLPALVPSQVIAPDKVKYPGNGYDPKVHHCPPGPDRWKLRSVTPQGIAVAMAHQWGQYCCDVLGIRL